MPKKKGKKRNGSMKEQMEGLAIAITPVTIEKKRIKKKEGKEIKVDDETLIETSNSKIFNSFEEMEGAGGVPQGPQELGTTGTGGGNIGTGNVPQRGEAQFSGTIAAAPPTG